MDADVGQEEMGEINDEDADNDADDDAEHIRRFDSDDDGGGGELVLEESRGKGAENYCTTPQQKDTPTCLSALCA